VLLGQLHEMRCLVVVGKQIHNINSKGDKEAQGAKQPLVPEEYRKDADDEANRRDGKQELGEASDSEHQLVSLLLLLFSTQTEGRAYALP
jgi:hypothetical protein